MSQLRSLAALSLCLHAFLLPHCFSHAAGAHSEPVFLVGPEPKPIVLDTVNSSPDNDTMIGNGVSVNDTFPENSEGGRKLNSHQTLHSSVTSRAGETLIQSHSFVRSHNGTNPAQASRFMQSGDCRITNTILGFNFDDNIVETGTARPPTNPHGAAGASRLVAVGNSMMEVRQKDGTLMFRKGLQSFFSSIPAASDSSKFYNPKVIYDEHEGRFVLVVLQRVDSLQVSRIWVAVSSDETPDALSSWKKVFIDSFSFGGNVFADDTGVEVDEEAGYITVNTYRFSDGVYAGVRLIWFDKGVDNGFYSGGLLVIQITNPFATAGMAATTVPAQVHGSSGIDGSVGTFFATVILKDTGQVDLQIYTIFNPLTGIPPFTFTIQTVSLGVINQIISLPDAPQLGSTVKIGTNTVTALDAVWRDNKLWVVFTINPANGINQGQATAHWVRLITKGGVVTLDSQGDLGGEDISTGAFTYFPSVAVNSQGMVAYGYSASSTKTYVGAYAAVGTSEKSYTVKNGLDPYVRTFSGANGWGGYTGISVDPTDGSFWVFNQYADVAGTSDVGGFGRWATVWGRLSCSVRNHIASVLNVLP
jgi:hypothetical protein